MDTSRSILKARAEEEKQIGRLHIINCAEAVAKKVGLNKMSMSAVAKEADLAPGTLYLYFKSKEELISQLALKSRERVLELFHEQSEQAENPLEAIRGMLMANYVFYKENSLYYDLLNFFETDRHLQESPEMERASRNITALVISVIDQAKSKGLVRDTIKASELSYIMWGTCTGMVQILDVKKQAISSFMNYSSQTMYESFVDIIIAGIKA
ncbi:MAG: TetR/AcrR family transcriptional regulator [Bacteroidota bacterium]